MRFMKTRTQKARMAGTSQVNESVNDVVDVGSVTNREIHEQDQFFERVSVHTENEEDDDENRVL